MMEGEGCSPPAGELQSRGPARCPSPLLRDVGGFRLCSEGSGNEGGVTGRRMERWPAWCVLAPQPQPI